MDGRWHEQEERPKRRGLTILHRREQAGRLLPWWSRRCWGRQRQRFDRRRSEALSEAVPDRICPHSGFVYLARRAAGDAHSVPPPYGTCGGGPAGFSSPGWLRTMAAGLLMVGCMKSGARVHAAALRWNRPDGGSGDSCGGGVVAVPRRLMATHGVGYQPGK